MSEEKEQLEWKEQVLKFVGKKLKNEGKNKEGVVWKIFTLSFATEGQYNFTLGCWNSLGDKEDSTTLKLNELEEGNYYLMKYKVKKDAFEAHGKTQDNRTVWHISNSDEEAWAKDKEKQLAERNQVVKEVTPPKKEVDKDDIFKHFEGYLASNFTKGVSSNVEQCIRSWFLNNHTSEYRLVSTELKNLFFKATEDKDVRLDPTTTTEEEVKEE